jgi:geranylgeranyl transferase type-2 subunit beta
MPSEPYLLRLGRRLSTGLAALPDEARARHRAFVLSRQNGDGGFSGREGGSDLYYTGFAVRTMAILNVLSDDDCRKIADFLRSCQRMQVTVIDLVSWLYCALVVQAASGSAIVAARECLRGELPCATSRIPWPAPRRSPA